MCSVDKDVKLESKPIENCFDRKHWASLSEKHQPLKIDPYLKPSGADCRCNCHLAVASEAFA